MFSASISAIASRCRRRTRHDARAAIVADHRRTLHHLVVSQVRFGPVAAELAHAGDELLRECALVETVGALARQQLEAGREIRLPDDVADRRHFAVDQEHARGVRRLEKRVLLEVHAAAQALIQRKSIARELDGRRQAHRQRQLAVLLRQVGHAGRLARNARGERRIARQTGDGVAVLVEEHVARGGAGRHLAQIDHGLVAIAGATKQEEPAAPQARAHDSTTASADATATAASNALPPLARICLPASLASG